MTISDRVECEYTFFNQSIESSKETAKVENWTHNKTRDTDRRKRRQKGVKHVQRFGKGWKIETRKEKLKHQNRKCRWISSDKWTANDLWKRIWTRNGKQQMRTKTINAGVPKSPLERPSSKQEAKRKRGEWWAVWKHLLQKEQKKIDRMLARAFGSASGLRCRVKVSN